MTLRTGMVLTLACAVLVSSPAAVSAQTAAATADDKVVCKKYQKTGTRFEEKTCKTRMQWEQLRIQQRQDAKEFMDKPTIETRRE